MGSSETAMRDQRLNGPNFIDRVDSLGIEMDGLAQELVDITSAEGLSEQARANAKAEEEEKLDILLFG